MVSCLSVSFEFLSRSSVSSCGDSHTGNELPLDAVAENMACRCIGSGIVCDYPMQYFLFWKVSELVSGWLSRGPMER